MRNGHGKIERRNSTRDLLFVLGMNEREEKADRDRFDFQFLQAPDQRRKFLLIQPHKHVTSRADTLAQTETEFIRHERGWAHSIQVVEFRARLPADGKHVFKTFGCYQGSARAASLQQCVSAHRGAVNNLDAFEFDSGLSCDLFQSLTYRERRIGWRRRELKNFETAVLPKHKIGKRAAGIDTDAHWTPDSIRAQLAWSIGHLSEAQILDQNECMAFVTIITSKNVDKKQFVSNI